MLNRNQCQPFLRQFSEAEAGVAPGHGVTAQVANEVTPGWLVSRFQSISLDQLNAKADMLQRLDNKYVIRSGDLQRAMPQLAKHFDVLEIDGQRDFTYDTCYFDDPALTNYFDQQRGRRKRCKVRMRKYVDAGLCFVEVKLKSKRSITDKKRMACDPAEYGQLNEQTRQFVESAYYDQYGSEYGLALEPVLEMRYRRVTLVAKQGGERMTIDYALEFAGENAARDVDHGIFLLETKSENANGVADKILRAIHQHPTEGCSKYCVAMAALHQVSRFNKFLVALRKLDMMPAVAGARPALQTNTSAQAATRGRAQPRDDAMTKQHRAGAITC